MNFEKLNYIWLTSKLLCREFWKVNYILLKSKILFDESLKVKWTFQGDEKAGPPKLGQSQGHFLGE